MQETRVQSLSWEEPLEGEMATHSSILAWKSHGQRNLADYSSWGHKESDMTVRLSTHAQGPCALSCSNCLFPKPTSWRIFNSKYNFKHLSVGTLTVDFGIQHTECSWHLHLLNRWMELPGSHPLFQKDHFQVVWVPEAGGSRKHGLD